MVVAGPVALVLEIVEAVAELAMTAPVDKDSYEEMVRAVVAGEVAAIKVEIEVVAIEAGVDGEEMPIMESVVGKGARLVSGVVEVDIGLIVVELDDKEDPEEELDSEVTARQEAVFVSLTSLTQTDHWA